MTYYTQDDLIAIVRAKCEGRTQKSLAEEFGISEPYLSDFLNGRRDAGPAILRALGLDEKPIYRAIPTPTSQPAEAAE